MSRVQHRCHDVFMTDSTTRRTASTTVGQAIDMSSLDDTVGFLLKRAQIAVSGQIHRIFTDFEITTVQFSVLTVASANPGITQAELAASLEVERPRMVPVLDSLERRGLAERRQDSQDGRSRRIYVTENGAAVLVELKSLFSHLENRFAEVLGNERRTGLIAALKALIDMAPADRT
jgi:DNA-binding MarR family transcriptional regulator